MSTTTTNRRSSLARRADEGTVAAYLREESSRVAPHARPVARPWRIQAETTPPRPRHRRPHHQVDALGRVREQRAA
jgi:hypothetical protein